MAESTRPGDPNAPLHGIQVLDMSRLHPGAHLTRLLAELGADVVKVEPPGRGSPERSIPFTNAALHHSKRSLGLDARHPDSVGVLDRLMAHADVVVESASPGSLDARGAGYAHFSEVNPRLVWLSLNGFGSDGPYAATAGHDINYLAPSGFLSRLHCDSDDALPDQPDVLLAGPIGAMMGVVGILAALRRRDQTGQGTFIDDTIAGAVTWFMADDIARASRGQAAWEFDTPARGTYRCQDGKRIVVAAAEPRTWSALCQGLGLDELDGQPGGPPDDKAGTRQRIADALATQPAAHWVATLGSAAVSPYHEPGEVPDDPHVQARGDVVDVPREDGGVDKIVRLPMRMSGVDRHQVTPAPAIGADTDPVLAEAGFSADEIAQMRESGVVG